MALVATPLAAIEEAKELTRRREIHLAMYPETKHGGDRKSEKSKGQNVHLKSFAEDTAQNTGKSGRAVRRSAGWTGADDSFPRPIGDSAPIAFRPAAEVQDWT